MKIAFISDIHGNYEALKSVLQKIDELNVDKIYCLGDVVGYYTQINECCNELINREIPTIMGNHDWYLSSGTGCPRSKSVNDCLLYQNSEISNYHLSWLRNLPVIRKENGINMVHGGWNNPIDEYLQDVEIEYFAEIEGNIFVSGHTHVPRLIRSSSKVYCNPGSVGQPRDGESKASFAVYDGESFTFNRVSYDIQKVAYLMDKAGFNDYYYGGLFNGSRFLSKLPEGIKLNFDEFRS